jgi:hypothetical protein
MKSIKIIAVDFIPEKKRKKVIYNSELDKIDLDKLSKKLYKYDDIKFYFEIIIRIDNKDFIYFYCEEVAAAKDIIDLVLNSEFIKDLDNFIDFINYIYIEYIKGYDELDHSYTAILFYYSKDEDIDKILEVIKKYFDDRYPEIKDEYISIEGSDYLLKCIR